MHTQVFMQTKTDHTYTFCVWYSCHMDMFSTQNSLQPASLCFYLYAELRSVSLQQSLLRQDTLLWHLQSAADKTLQDVSLLGVRVACQDSCIRLDSVCSSISFKRDTQQRPWLLHQWQFHFLHWYACGKEQARCGCILRNPVCLHVAN